MPTPGSNVILLGHDLIVSRVPDVATVSNTGPSSIVWDERIVANDEMNKAWERVVFGR